MSLYPCTRRMVGLLTFALLFVMGSLCAAQSNAPIIPHPRSRTVKKGAPPAVSPGNWSQRAKLVASNFYASVIASGVAISGDTTVISTEAFRPFTNAVADVFVKTAQGWQNTAPVAKLIGSEPGQPYITPVAIDGDTIVVAGAVGFDGVAGYVFVYEKPAGGWKDMVPTAVLTPSDTTDTEFGDSVSISGDTIVVGDNGFSGYTAGLGAAYVYVKPKGGWHSMTETAKLTASDGVNTDLFGWSVSISGGTIVVGATQYSFSNPGTGKAYVFVKPSTGWTSMTQTAELTATGLVNGDVFGFSAAVDGDVIVVGSYPYNGFLGAAFVYQKPAGGWANMTQTATLTEGDGTVGEFALSVAISGNIIIAGAPYRGTNPDASQGAVYVFEEPAGGWQNMASNTVLIGSDAHYNNSFGYFVGISGKTLVSDAQFRLQAPAAYVFSLP
jgi:hypothetical protein